MECRILVNLLVPSHLESKNHREHIMSKDILSRLTVKLEGGEDLTPAEARAAALALADAVPDTSVKKSFLVGLSQKGESPSEVSAFARAFREMAVDPGVETYRESAIDVCGTGGDKSGSFNLSTTTAMILAAAGVPVFKHGNRSITSGCGSADLLERLGVSLQGGDADHAKALEALNFTFFFAPAFHPAFKEIMPVRQALGAEGVRTIFNILGPLINPGRPAYQLLGVFSRNYVEPLAEALDALGLRRGIVVHTSLGDGAGMDELACCGTCHVAGFGELKGLREDWTPESFGLAVCTLDDVRGGDLERNVEILDQVFSGSANPGLIDSICLNAGAALWCAGRAEGIKEGVDEVRGLLDRGVVAAWLARARAHYLN